ncbi:DUF4339 domain-containing protein [Shewanella intestini]|uniref:DUF4339 domain-containing protein n=1 Tax=Shewanella intestini TaxID=2017544 RepID=A0ABS5I3Y9_9GAMM|nr:MULTISPECIES: DUF4339 domain-containing protein [Shewanella]MBR9728538.1 DUF4339 domain-containing protein [Shewanella intestini]MRG36357.1 DUF4339 domain-containing protein [Shewanella sp. XMDDZSB0408]
MKEWYFSNNGEVTGPLGLAASNKFIKANPDTYAWHPSYAHWIPICDVEEFDMIASPPPPPIEVPQELIESMLAKEQELNSALNRIESTLQVIHGSLNDLDRDSSRCKTTTQNLNEQVKTTLRSVNEQYAALQKNLAGVSDN